MLSGSLLWSPSRSCEIYKDTDYKWVFIFLIYLLCKHHALVLLLLTISHTIFCVIMDRKSLKSIVPVPSLSISAIIFFISSFFGSKPKARIATYGNNPITLLLKRMDTHFLNVFSRNLHRLNTHK